MKLLLKKLFFAFVALFYTIHLRAQCAGNSGNILINPSFEFPIQPNLGNNIISWPIIGWNGLGSPPNIVKTNGGPSTGGPNNASDGIQYLDIGGPSADFYQEFEFQCNVQVYFSGYFSIRDNIPSTGRIDLLRVNTNNTTALIASSTQLNMPSTPNIWYFTSGSTIITPGKYRFNITMGNNSNFDNACFSYDYPIINTGSYGPLCESGGSITLTGIPTDSFGVWSGNGIIDNGNGTASFNPLGLGSTIVPVTYSHYNTLGFGCAQTTEIIVNSSIIPTFTKVTDICPGAMLASLPTTSDNGITGTWSPALNNTATTLYTFTPDAGQCSATASMTIRVNPSITPTFTQVFDICSGATLSSLPTTSDNGITGTWSPALNNSATTTYTFTPDAGQCASITTMTINVNPNITPTFTQVSDICSGATLSSLPTTSNNGITGTWSPALNNTATTTYAFTPDAGQCATTASMTIIVNQLPTPPTGDSQQNFCAINNPIISDLLLNSNFINWYLEQSGGTPLNPNYSLTDGLTLFAASYDPITNCENPSRFQVIVQVENPVPPFISLQQVFCLENNITIEELNTNGVPMIWYDSPVGGNTVLPTYILQNGDTFYGAAINTTSGCKSTTRTAIEISLINSNLDFNNLITLDDNDLNKELLIYGIEHFPNNKIEVYNRYGNLVWSGINYDNVSNTFKGMANVSGVVSKGSYLPTGTYFFILSYPNDCEKTELKGFIHIDNKL